ncbi:MAG: inositol monophosphatase family protein [Beijerinckiaceae bacterium]
MIRTPLMNVMTAAATKAARGLKRDFGEVALLQVSRKGPGDFVSAADKKSERVIFEELSRARPGYGFLMEESGAVEGADKTHVWHIDPLDGTTNFLHGIPQFAISIALERDGQLVAGLVYNPVTDEMFIAEKGQGAYLNNQRLRVAQRTDFREAVIGCGIPHIGRGDHKQFQAELGQVMAIASGVRRMGAAALDLAYVAAGRFDGFWERRLSTWDMAAGAVLIREAGGYVTDINGHDGFMATGDIACGNEQMLKELLKLIKKANPA